MQIIHIVSKFRKILPKGQGRKIFGLAILMIIGGFLEMFSVSLVLPFMEAMMSSETIMNKWYIKEICDILHICSFNTFLVLLSFFLGVLYILKNIYLIFEYNLQYRFVYSNMYTLQNNILDRFLHRSYEYFLSIDSGEIIRVMSTDISDAFALLTNMLMLLTELVVSGTLIITIFAISPYITLAIALLLLILVFVINKYLEPYYKKMGTQSQIASAGMNKWLLQSVQGIKDVMVMQKEDYFQDNYKSYGKKYVNVRRINQIFAILPRFVIEAVSMSAVFFVFGAMILTGASIESMIPVITVIAMAALRLLPSINRISSCLANIGFSEPMLDKLILNLGKINSDTNPREYSVEGKQEPESSDFKESIELTDVTYMYPTGNKNIIDHASLKICKGESVGIKGKTGAGKSTAVDIMLGLLNPQSGQILLDGVDIRENIPSWLSKIGYIPQMIFMLDSTIKANVAFGVNEDEVDEARVWRALDEASLGDFIRELPEGIETQIGERGIRLSGGQRQRLGIARALYTDPDILFFDEATSALDNETEKYIMESVDKLHGQKTLIIIAHRLTTIESCDHVYVVENGKITKER